MQPKTLFVPNHIFLEEVRRQLKAGHSATFRVRGWSMRPFVEHARDSVLLVSPKERPVRVGEVALVLANDGRYVLHRVVDIDASGCCTLWGDGNAVGREYCTPDNVIGVVQGFYIGKKERYYDVDGRLWRWYSWFWMHTSCIRRYELFLCRIWFKVIGSGKK